MLIEEDLECWKRDNTDLSSVDVTLPYAVIFIGLTSDASSSESQYRLMFVCSSEALIASSQQPRK